MAGGMLFPDIAGALSSGAQAGAASAQGRFLMEDRAARNEIAPLIPKALQGDREALDQIGARHPDTLMKITPLLERADAATRARAKEASEWTTKAAMGVLSLPEAERPAAYQAALADGQRLGYKIDMPPQYDRAVEGRLRMVVNQAQSVSDFLKSQGEGVTFAPPVGGGGAPASGGGVNPNNIGNVRPVGGGPSAGFQQPASLDDGIRLAVNNVKAYPAKFNGGQPMTLLQIGERWAPRGDGANDPVQWARNVASIGGLDPNQPLDLNDPMTAAKFARGVHGAEHGANKVLPLERYAQAITGGAQPPGLAQGSDMPAADGSGTPLPPAQQALAPLKGLQIPPGARVALKGGLPVIQDGNVLYLDANGNWGAAPLPSRAAPKEQGSGPFAGNSVEAQALNMLIANGTLTQPQAAELAAGKTITNPADGSVMFMTPSGIFGQKPGQAPQPVGPASAPQSAAPIVPATAGAPAGVPASATAANPGVIPITGPKPVKPEQMTESQAKAYGFAQRMATANSLLDDLAIQGTSKRGRFLEGLPGGIGNLAQTPEFQRFEQAKRNFMNAQLRDESGAVIGPSEFMSADLQYFPQPGQATNKELIAQMAENRRQVVEAMMVKAGMLKRGERYDPPAKTVDPAEKGRLLFEAKKAIAEGRDPNGVREKLKKLGVDPAELDGAN